MTERTMTLGWIQERYEKVGVPFTSSEVRRWGAYDPDRVTESDIDRDFWDDVYRLYPKLMPELGAASLSTAVKARKEELLGEFYGEFKERVRDLGRKKWNLRKIEQDARNHAFLSRG